MWKAIKGYEGLYEVSDTGEVRSLERKVEHRNGIMRTYKSVIVKPSRYKNKGYKIKLYKNGIYKRYAVARLVAYTFYDQDMNDNMTVNHIDGNNTNNNLENLEIISMYDNIQHAYQNGLMTHLKKVTLQNENETLAFNSYMEASRYLQKSYNYVASLVHKGIMRTKDHEIIRG